jgi:hypothetical protein
MLLTPARISAASRICRFGGWTTRHYSILEHQVVGCIALRQMDAPPDVQKAFLIHDMHETEIVGDVRTPDKALYLNDRYGHAVAVWDASLCLEIGLPFGMLRNADVKMMDTITLGVESQLVFTGEWRAYTEDCPEVDIVTDLIKSEKYADTKAIFAFQTLMGLLS